MGSSSLISIVLTTTVASIATVLTGYYFFKKNKIEVPPTEWKKIGRVKKIYLFPLKSGNYIQLQRAVCTEVGLMQSEEDEKAFQLRDRCLVVYKEGNYEFRTARTYPKLLKIDVSVHDEDHLAIDAPTMRTLYVKIPKNHVNDIKIKQWRGEQIPGVDLGDEAAGWFSRYILEKESGFRVAYNNATERRNITKSHKVILDFWKKLSNKGTGLFHDLSSIHIINQASVDDLVKRIGDSSEVTSDNFRPNIIIEGPEPLAEDHWDWIKVGDVVMRNVKDCTRCSLTTLNPENCVKNKNMEPLKTLKTYRLRDGPEKDPIMGFNAEVFTPNTIYEGDDFYIGASEEK